MMNGLEIYHKGRIVGYQGHRAVIFDVDERTGRLRVLYHEQLAARTCHHCDGSGWITLGQFRSSHRSQSCDACRGTGELPAERVARTAWAHPYELRDAPAPVESPVAAEAAAAMTNPRAVFDV